MSQVFVTAFDVRTKDFVTRPRRLSLCAFVCVPLSGDFRDAVVVRVGIIGCVLSHTRGTVDLYILTLVYTGVSVAGRSRLRLCVVGEMVRRYSSVR